MITMYVDGIHATCNDPNCMLTFKAQFGTLFKMKYMGDHSQVLSMHITRVRTARTILMDWSKYVKEILDKHNISDYKPSSIPMTPGSCPASPLLIWTAKDVYASLLGSLQHAIVCIRLDVSTTRRILGSAQASLTEAHLQALKKVESYPKETIELR
jgi:hypothetical protein